MRLAGISISLSDWEDHVSAILWCTGCNYRCQYCQNPELFDPSVGKLYTADQLIEELGFQKIAIDSVIFCGGEPTLQSFFLTLALGGIKNLDLSTKLDTNGSSHWVLKETIAYLDKVSIDLKAPWDDPNLFTLVTGTSPESAGPLLRETMNCVKYPYRGETIFEGRTTIVPGLIYTPEHVKAIIEPVADYLDEYTLQTFQNQKVYNPLLKAIDPPTPDYMQMLADVASDYIDKVNIRPRPL